MFASLARAPGARPAWRTTRFLSERPAEHVPRAPGCPRTRPSAPAAADRGAPAAAARESREGRGDDASTSSPSVPVVTRAPPPAGTAEVVVRYAYPGVRFSQAKVVIARVPAAASGDAADATATSDSASRDAESSLSARPVAVTVTGARVLEALKADGVDVRRWRARVALDHDSSDVSMWRSSERSFETNETNAGENADGFAARRVTSTKQTLVGWRALRDDDVVDFHQNAVGLLVQLEDGLVAKMGTADEAYDAREDKKKGGGRRGAKARARRAAKEASSEDDARGDERERDECDDTSQTSPSRASSYWKSPSPTSVRTDGRMIESSSAKNDNGNNPYAGARSLGTTIWPKDPNGANAGFFGVGVVKPKHEANVGTLWRSAWQLGAGFIFTVGTRFKYEASDTTQAHKQIPLFKHEDWESFAKASPHGAVWVAVEMGSGSVPLQDFVHPPRAVYVLGSEDNGLNRPIVEACQCHVSLPKWVGRSSSYNVATAGALVMYDRLVKRLRDGAYDAKSDE
jgi:tRNA(Leu) C34 or U34 (ribose-2'-O)-methylase TrmL